MMSHVQCLRATIVQSSRNVSRRTPFPDGASDKESVFHVETKGD